MKSAKKALSTTITYVILYAVLSLVGFYPLISGGKSFVWCIDSAGQYFPAFVYIGKYMQRFLQGLFGGRMLLPHFDLSLGMGEGVIGCLNYYGFGDPFNLIAVFVNESNAAALFATAYFLRTFFAGLAFMYYLTLMGIDEKVRPVGAVCYVFSGFAVCGGIMYLSWGSVLFFFPLMLAGIERIIRNRKDVWLFGVSVLFGALCGFYFLYMSSLALAVYCLVRFFCRTKKDTLKNCAYCVLIYLGAAVIASPILIPTIKAFLSSERNSSAFDIIFNYHYYVPRISTFMEVIKSTLLPERYDFWLGVLIVEWLMIIVLFFLPNTVRRIQLKIAVLVFLLASSMKITGYAFNAFGETNDRYAFLFHFLAAVVLCDVFTYFLQCKSPKKFLSIYGTGVLYLLVCANIIFNVYELFGTKGCNWQEEFVGSTDTAEILSSPVGEYDEIAADYEKGEVFRVSLDHFSIANDRPENVAMLNKYYGMTYWFSIVNGYTQKYVDDYNKTEMIWRSYGLENDPYALALSGCKYIIKNAGSQNESIEINPLYKGFAFVCDADSLKAIEESDMSFEMKNQAIYEMADYDSVKNLAYDNIENKCEFDVNFNETDETVTEDDVATGGKVIVVALPYSTGWKATVYGDGTGYNSAYDPGKKVDITRNEMFCSIPVSGLHNIKVSLTYK